MGAHPRKHAFNNQRSKNKQKQQKSKKQKQAKTAIIKQRLNLRASASLSGTTRPNTISATWRGNWLDVITKEPTN